MHAVVYPGAIAGRITAPPSKSMTQRAYAAALLHTGHTIIHHAGTSDDEQAALDVIIALGATITGRSEHTIEIHSNGIQPRTDTIHCGESGLAARLFTPIAALASVPLTITGSGTLKRRPMPGFADTFSALGITVTGFAGMLPITIQGPMQASDINIDAAYGSQLLSGLLFALSYAATQRITVKVESLSSRPYIDLTLDVLRQFGRHITHNHYKEFIIDPAAFTHAPTVEITVEGDWSGSANLLAAAAIAGNITINNLSATSAQADRAIVDILKQTGAEVSQSADSITISTARLKAFDFDATHCPDLFPILAVLAACSMGDSNITGVHRLFHKESNRAESISEMLQNFNVPFSIEEDTLCISSVQQLQGTIIDSYDDHRIIMAAAIGALNANGPVDIPVASPVTKSYPLFFNDLSLCGIQCKLT